MKKIFILLLVMICMYPLNIYANERKEVKLKKCIDGDTISVILNKKVRKIRLLAIDTPETNHPEKGEEPFGKEAKDFTCNKLIYAKKIELEFDKNSNNKDKYNRNLAWVFYDGNLLQNELVKNGYAEVTYLYDDYKYTGRLKDSENYAKIHRKGIYSNKDTSYYRRKNNLEKRIKNRLKKFMNKIYSNINKLFDEILEEII